MWEHLFHMTKIKFMTVLAVTLSLAVFAGGCATNAPSSAPEQKAAPTMTAQQKYIKDLNDRVDPFWKEELKTSFNDSKKVKALVEGHNQVTCALELRMDKNGKVKKTKLLKSSGYKAVDTAALNAIKKASPLPPPPSAWVKNKTATIRWEFVLKDQ
jgi:protein TonB